MQLQEVNSKMFSKVGFLPLSIPETGPLGDVVVEFPAKKDKEPILCRYFCVPEDVYLAMMHADSRGAAFATTIRGNYEFEYITATEAEAL